MELSNELGEVLTSEMERVVREIGEDERRLLAADAAVEVDDVDAKRTGKLFEESLDRVELVNWGMWETSKKALKALSLRTTSRGVEKEGWGEKEVEGITEVEEGADKGFTKRGRRELVIKQCQYPSRSNEVAGLYVLHSIEVPVEK